MSRPRTPATRPSEEIDEATKFLISKKKEGQFRALWGDFGELVNLMASGEMVVCDAWQPAVMAVKAQGKACKYAVPKEGYRAWAIGPSLIAGSPNRRPSSPMPITGCPARRASPCPEQGYYSPTDQHQESDGPPTNTPSGTRASPGSARPSAASRRATCATAARSRTRSANVAYWHQWPDEYDYVIQKWDEFLNA